MFILNRPINGSGANGESEPHAQANASSQNEQERTWRNRFSRRTNDNSTDVDWAIGRRLTDDTFMLTAGGALRRETQSQKPFVLQQNDNNEAGKQLGIHVVNTALQANVFMTGVITRQPIIDFQINGGMKIYVGPPKYQPTDAS